MQSSNAYQMSSAFALLAIGTPKAGKTVFALNFPTPWVLDCDNNLAGALRYHKHSEKPFVFFFDNPNTVEESKRWEFCMKAIKEAIAHPDVKTIIVDGLSLLGYYLEKHVLANSTKGTGGMNDLVIAGEKVMNMSQWGPFKNLMSQFVMACKSCGKLFVMTCHETTEINDKGTITGYVPLISGSLRSNIAGFFTDVWRLETETTPKGASYSVRFAPRTMMQIGNSLSIKDNSFDLTGKTRKEVWAKIAPYFNMPLDLVA